MPKVVIKKYANRRLYDTERSSYITLDDLSRMIREGREVEVIDAKSGDDITHQVLTQIIVEEEADGGGMLPVSFLRELISMYGGAMQGAVPTYLEAAMAAFREQQKAMGGAFDPSVMTEMARRNMEMFQSAASAFTPGASAGAGKEGKDEVEKLRAELAALKAKVDKL
ncbi:polyhydroxyalkanoate synthesis repressor PhaR [Sphingomicrobium astaxanthinifaciens]|uniref:polyhydroxyalkanoate synthesis repressor PhaR n=1 Tax=Sphingomicrobium astaxanthinifaciens TaxID=1227949 RepID=UPI001FCB333A|nr:polyhydroxyalkanoate synthesis repressor PhaR [Sphingomicrobium astaxanthinifaciens]MCJ7421965.1 polyhydroxyalkanoate synthesis repressor PhaR [Sphingomicrobium astaxanthinifaciens]